MSDRSQMSYYDRRPTTHVDGTQIFQTAEDQEAENATAAMLEKRFDCQLRRFGMLAPVDWYATRHGRLIGVLEFKTRSHSSGAYSTVFLNVRKWLALSLASVGLNVPAVFVVRFTDGIRWIRLDLVDATKNRIAGTVHLVKSRNDQEPIIDVPIAAMRVIALEET